MMLQVGIKLGQGLTKEIQQTNEEEATATLKQGIAKLRMIRCLQAHAPDKTDGRASRHIFSINASGK